MEFCPAALLLPCSHSWGPPYPKKGVEGTILHELSDDHDRCALGDNPFQVDDIGVVELAHDGCLTQEVPALLLCVSRLESLDGYKDLSLAWQLQVATTDLTKLSWDRHREMGTVSCVRWEVLPTVLSLHCGYFLTSFYQTQDPFVNVETRADPTTFGRVGPSRLPQGIWDEDSRDLGSWRQGCSGWWEGQS